MPDDTTPNLQLPYIMAAQAQKHVTHNEALRILDVLVQLSVLDRDLAMPPSAPLAGQRYIVPAGATGDWVERAGAVAAFEDGAWTFLEPRTGWLAWIADEARLAAFDGSGWVDAIELGAGIPSTLGINAEADTNNRLALSSPASLFDHEGNGHRLKINKAGVGDTASLLLQTGYSGRAEIGTAGDDSLHVKVSPDGSLWHEAIVIDPSTGAASFPNSVLGVAGPVDGGAAEAPVDFDAAIDGGGAGTGSVVSIGGSLNLRLAEEGQRTTLWLGTAGAKAGALRIDGADAETAFTIDQSGTSTDYPVATVRPVKTGSVCAIDLMPNGAPASLGGWLTWIDVCDADVHSGAGGTTCARIGAGTDGIFIGSISFGGAAKPMHLMHQGISRMTFGSPASPSGWMVSADIEVVADKVFRSGVTTVAGLPSPGLAKAGARHFVTDASVATFGAAVAGGGGNKVPVWCDGAAWYVG